MSRKNAKPAPAAEAAPIIVAGTRLRKFDGIDAAFGAALGDYPPMEALPEEYRRNNAAGCKIASSLFFNGGSLDAHGRSIKSGVDRIQFLSALRALLSSFAPKHEHKIAACGALIDECTVAAGKGGAA